MKKNLITKSLLVTVLGATALSANALVYVQVDGGYTRLYTDAVAGLPAGKALFTDRDGSKVSPRVTLGLSYGTHHRLALDYTHWGTFDSNIYSPNDRIVPHTLGLKYTYTFDTPIVKPYVGLRLNYTYVNLDFVNHKMSKSYGGYGALAGVEFKLFPVISFGVGVEYNKLTNDFNGKTLYTSAFIRADF